MTLEDARAGIIELLVAIDIQVHCYDVHED